MKQEKLLGIVLQKLRKETGCNNSIISIHKILAQALGDTL
jgi:hypothetical protein